MPARLHYKQVTCQKVQLSDIYFKTKYKTKLSNVPNRIQLQWIWKRDDYSKCSKGYYYAFTYTSLLSHL